MPLRDRAAFNEWVDREAPSLAARRIVQTFMIELGDAPWRGPSTPIPELSDQPTFEMRTALLPVPGEDAVQLWYLHAYATGDVDIIAVTNR